MDEVNITIIGAGVIGLAIAAEISKYNKNVFVIERHHAFGQETSSRNSEVIHAGIYYPKDSLKTITCLEGKELIYGFCKAHGIAHKKIGKLIVAIDDGEVEDLSKLHKQGLENGVKDLEYLTGGEVKSIEPRVEAKAAIYSPSTGILDTHAFMAKLKAQAKSRGADIAYNTTLVGIDRSDKGFEVWVGDKKEGIFKFLSRILINAAGLNSDTVARAAGIKRSDYKLYYCKGDYFRVHNNKARFINRLIYPVPRKERRGLGIHATLDLGGGLRLGPDDEYVSEINYNIDESKKNAFFESVSRFLPFVALGDLAPDTSGIRPKLQGSHEAFRDFVISEESELGLPGLINLIGIESPGFTASLSIARLVAGMVENHD